MHFKFSSLRKYFTGKLPHKYKVVIAGNHEIGFEDGEEMSERQLAGLSMLGINKAYEMLTNCIYLCDRSIEVSAIFLVLLNATVLAHLIFSVCL